MKVAQGLKECAGFYSVENLYSFVAVICVVVITQGELVSIISICLCLAVVLNKNDG